jgi:hypothetical protein
MRVLANRAGMYIDFYIYDTLGNPGQKPTCRIFRQNTFEGIKNHVRRQLVPYRIMKCSKAGSGKPTIAPSRSVDGGGRRLAGTGGIYKVCRTSNHSTKENRAHLEIGQRGTVKGIRRQGRGIRFQPAYRRHPRSRVSNISNRKQHK